MNTSNKILAIFFLFIFLVPVFVLLSFNSKIKSGDFTVVVNEHSGGDNFRSGNFQPYKVIKLVAPPGRALKCNLQYADSLYYSYNRNDVKDSVRVYNLADTLFIQYISATNPKDNTDTYGINDIYVELKLPTIEQLVINNAEATIQSKNAGANDNLHVELYGTGILNLGETDEENRDATAGKATFSIGQLSIKSTNGKLAVGSNTNIGQLTIQGDGASTVTIKEGATINGMQGNLSDSSTVNASWKYVKRLAVLQEK